MERPQENLDIEQVTDGTPEQNNRSNIHDNVEIQINNQFLLNTFPT